MFHFHVPKPVRHLLRTPLHTYYELVTAPLRPFQFVLVLGHMRSGSSLLSNLLRSNPAVRGYGEAMVNYEAPNDLKWLRSKVLFMTQSYSGRVNERYILDKVLHDGFLAAEDATLLLRDDVRTIFLLREPRGTLRSIMKRMDYTAEQAVDYYTARLKSLADVASIVTAEQQAVFLTQRQLIYETPAIFTLLEDYLDLQEPLTEEYEVTELTGDPQVGDSSDRLRTGRIIREERSKQPDPVPHAMLVEAETVFAQTRRTLESRCRHIRQVPAGAETSRV